MHPEVSACVDRALACRDPALATLTQLEKGHGQLETTGNWQSRRLEWFGDREKWAGLRSVGMVEATREAGGKTTVERRFCLNSLPMEVATFARAVRGHRATDNQCH